MIMIKITGMAQKNKYKICTIGENGKEIERNFKSWKELMYYVKYFKEPGGDNKK